MPSRPTEDSQAQDTRDTGKEPALAEFSQPGHSVGQWIVRKGMKKAKELSTAREAINVVHFPVGITASFSLSN